MRILNIEDNVVKHMAVKRVVESCGVREIVWARTFEEGMLRLAEPFDLVISDMQFPMRAGERDDPDAGEKVIAKIRERGLSVPVVICSSVRYHLPEAKSCIWYSDLSEWSQELRELIRGLG